MLYATAWLRDRAIVAGTRDHDNHGEVNEMDQDRIEREVVIAAPPERVWAALTKPDQIAGWFGDRVEIDLRPGGEARFTFEGYETSRSRVEVVEPLRRFAFRWHADGSDPTLPVEEVPNTLVEFTLEAIPEGTRLTLVESGFASLPAEVRDKARRGNEQGLTQELGELVAYLGVADNVAV